MDLGSDQTSLHNPFSGGYYPAQLSLHQANQLMATDPARFKTMVHERLDFDAVPFLKAVGLIQGSPPTLVLQSYWVCQL